MNPYKILGVSSSTSVSEIKKAYRELAKIHHPDKGGDPDKFKQIARAYEVLSNESSKEYYDITGKMPDDNNRDRNDISEMNMGAAGIDLSGLFSGIFGFGGGGGGGGGIFPGFFPGQYPSSSPSSSPQQEKPPARIEKLSLTLAQLFTGYTFKLQTQRSKVCSKCSGSGAAETEVCSNCSGSGSYIKTMNMGGLIMQTHSVCMECRGEGKKTVHLCDNCSGSGKTKEERVIDVIILPGTMAGEKIIFPEICSEIEGFRKAGDLIIEIVQLPVENWTRNGDDLHISISLPIEKALIGGTTSLNNHPSQQEIIVTIPPATFTDDIITMHGNGMPQKGNTEKKGILYVKISNIHPVSENNKEKIRQNLSELQKIFAHL